ncbi:MAG: VOC family protein [Alphaproteobacteria bacterium]|nr:VOC family protein [Alphaproteobacteria bacterium]
MIKVDDIAFVRFKAPDLDQMETFLTDFGLVRAHRDADTLYMTGSGPDPYLHVTHKGEPGFAGVAFKARSLDDLNAFAKSQDAKVEALDGPGGGKVVRLTDPNGHPVELVAGRSPVKETALRPLGTLNDAHKRPRRNELKRVGQGPSHVIRLGHCVLNVVDFRASEAWYKERFGFITSDEIKLSPEFALGAFMRCDRGEEPADHHTIFLVGTGTPGFNHAAFEVADFDDLMSGHDVLKEKAYTHQWGIGRHYLGSQIFDYWKDPWGHTLEHWTDGDLLTASWGSRDSSLPELAGVQWGMKMPPNMG